MQSDKHYVNLTLDCFMKDKSKILKGLFEKKPVVVSEVENNTDCPSRPVHVYVSDVKLTHSCTGLRTHLDIQLLMCIPVKLKRLYTRG